jgi:elongation factor P
MYQTSDIRKGLKIEMDGSPWIVVDFLFVKPGKGTAFTRTKLKNLLSGNVVDRTWRTGETLQEADVTEATMQYLYPEGDRLVFMNLEDFNQIPVPRQVLGNNIGFLLEQAEVQVLFYKGTPVSVDLPNFIEAEITYCEPGIKGNTATGATKEATLSTGATIQVPLFVENGTWVKVDTRTGSYVERVKR